MIRYENLFFDPELQDVTMTHTGWDNYEYQCTSHKVSSYGEAGKIWMILREKDYRKCIYLLNLCGQSEDYWNEGKEEPNIQKDIKFTVQHSRRGKHGRNRAFVYRKSNKNRKIY